MPYQKDEVNRTRGRIRKKTKNEFSSELTQIPGRQFKNEKVGKNEELTERPGNYEIYPGE